jgi:hypothetical protein
LTQFVRLTGVIGAKFIVHGSVFRFFPCYHTARATNEINFAPLPVLTACAKSNTPIVLQIGNEWAFLERRREHNKRLPVDLNERISELLELEDDAKFLYQLSREILELASLHENRFTGILIELSTKWGEYRTLNQNNYEDVRRRSAFRYEVWKDIDYWKGKYMRN